MGAEETDAKVVQDERRASRRFVIILGASILIAFALLVGALYLLFAGKLRRMAPGQRVAPSSSVAATTNRGESVTANDKECAQGFLPTRGARV